MRAAFEHHLGVPKLMVKHLPFWPKPNNNANWPMDASTNARLLHFQWNENYDHSDNFTALKTIMNFIHTKGASFCPAAAKAIQDISEEDLQQCIIQKFQELQKNLCQAKLLTTQHSKAEEANGDTISSPYWVVTMTQRSQKMKGCPNQSTKVIRRG